MNENPNRVKTSTKFFYAMGEFPGGYLTTIISFFFLIYLTDFIKISPAWAGIILFVGFIFDGITDPMAGYMSDKSKHRFGRRRIFMLWTIIPLGIIFCLMFTVPSFFRNSSEPLKILVVLIIYFIYILFYTYYTTPFFAIINDITDNYDERTAMMSWRMSLSILAILIGVIIPDFLGLSDVQTFSTKAFFQMGLVFGLLVISSGLISVLGMKERKDIEHVSTGKFSFKSYFLDSWKCEPFRQACLSYFCSFGALAAINTCLIYYLNYYLQLPQLFLPIAGGVMIIAIVFLPFWNFMCKKIGKKKSQILGALMFCAGLLMLAVIPANLGRAQGEAGDLTTISYSMVDSLKLFPVMAYVATIIVSCGFSAMQMVSSAIVPDAINFSADKKNEGAYYGVVTLVFKIGTGLASLVIGLILEITGYIEPPVSMAEGQIVIQSGNAQIGILLVFAGLPCLLAALSIFFLKNYKIDRLKLEEKTSGVPASIEEETVVIS